MATVASFIAGALFALGLLVSGMADPAKVLGFLDVAGAWDPSLLLVMGGAVAVAAAGFRLAGARTTSLFAGPMQIPPVRAVDRRLVVGSIVFGIGWGLAGFCPGPAIVAIGLSRVEAVVFGVAMLVGMAAWEWFARVRERRDTAGATVDEEWGKVGR